MPEMGKLRLNSVEAGRQVVTTPDLKAGKVDFFEGASSEPRDLEAACFINAVMGKGQLYVTAEQAACVTRILEGIYQSEKTGKPYYFD